MTTATLFVFAPIGGSLVNRLGERALVVAGLILQAAGFCWISLIARPDLVPFGGGVPLRIDGRLMGAVAVSGATSIQDHEIVVVSVERKFLRFVQWLRTGRIWDRKDRRGGGNQVARAVRSRGEGENLLRG